MRKLAALTAFLVCLLLGSCQGFVVPGALSPAEQSHASVKVLSDCEDKATGSGVLVAPRLAVTARHVVPCDEAQVAGVDAQVFSHDEEADVAVLYLHEPLNGRIPTIGPVPSLDERVCIEPSHPERRRSCGWVVGRHSGVLKLDSLVWPGNSGSGVWDAQGRLVGIVTTFRVGPNAQITGGSAATLDDKRYLFGGAL